MARLPIVVHNVPFTPFLDKTVTDIGARYVPECLTTTQVDPVTGQQNKVYAVGWSELNLWPPYDIGNLQRPAAYGKTPEDGW